MLEMCKELHMKTLSEQVEGVGVGGWIRWFLHPCKRGNITPTMSHVLGVKSQDLEGLFCMNWTTGASETVSPIGWGNLPPEDVNVLGILHFKRKCLEIRR